MYLIRRLAGDGVFYQVESKVLFAFGCFGTKQSAPFGLKL